MTALVSHLPVDAWTLLGRLPVAAAMALLFLHLRGQAGARRAALAVSGLAAGVLAGTALVPSILGSVAGGAAVWLLTQRLLGVRTPTAYVFTRLMLMVVGVGRFGCFVAGCCFGRPSDLPWAVQYGSRSLAHELHFHLGRVGPGDAALPVHPVQLYEGVALLLLAAVLPRLRRWIANDRALAPGVGATYLLLRFALEPLRAMVNTPGSARFLGHLSLFQWGALALALLLGATAVWLRHQPEARRFVAPVPPAGVLRMIWLGQAALAVLAQSSMTPFLIRLAVAALAFSLTTLVVAEWRRAMAPRPRLAMGVLAALVLLSPLVLRATEEQSPDEGRRWIYDVQPQSEQLVRIGDQATPPEQLQANHDALVPDPPPAAPTRPPWRYSLLAYGGGGRSSLRSFGCGGPTTVWDHAVLLGGIGVQGEQRLIDWRQTWQLRLGVFRDAWQTTTMERNGSVSFLARDLDLMGTLTGWYQVDWHWVGLGIGAQLALGGQLGSGRPEGRDPIEPALGQLGFLLPGIYLRIGPPVFGVEAGTGSLRNFLPGAQLNLRSELMGHELRLGVEAMRLTTPVLGMTAFGDARISLGEGNFLQLHFGMRDLNTLFGSFAFTHDL